MAKRKSGKKKPAGKARPPRKRFPGMSPATLDRLRAMVPPDVELITTPEGFPKLSNEIIELVGPELDDLSDDPTAVGLLFGVGVTAWNASQLPEEDVEAYIMDELAEHFEGDPDQVEQVFQIALLLVDRKREMFPHDPRWVLHHEVREEKGQFLLTAIGSLGRPSLED